jgi:hypothetical protein
MKEGEPKQPTIIDLLNNSLKKEALFEADIPTVQGIAKEFGITENMLNDWLTSDAQFAGELQRVHDIKNNTPKEFRFTEEDGIPESYVSATMIAFVLLETKERKNLTD